MASDNSFANAERVEINQEFDYTATCEVPAWDERYVILPGVYKAVFRQYYQGHPFTNVVVKARVVSAKKSALWGGVAVTEARGPDAGTVVEVEIPVAKIAGLPGVVVRNHWTGRVTYACVRPCSGNFHLFAYEGQESLAAVIDAYRREMRNYCGGGRPAIWLYVDGEYKLDATELVNAVAKAAVMNVTGK